MELAFESRMLIDGALVEAQGARTYDNVNPATESVIGPVAVPRRVTELCKPMWDIGGVVAKTSAGWRFVEVWNVSP